MDFEREMLLVAAGALSDASINCKSQQLYTTKAEAIEKVTARCRAYHQHGYDPKLVRAVHEKKLKLIGEASTCKVLNKLKKPSAPTYSGGTFSTDETWVPEEELIQWSLASLRAPLPSYAFERYMDLFRQVMGIDALERCNPKRE